MSNFVDWTGEYANNKVNYFTLLAQIVVPILSPEIPQPINWPEKSKYLPSPTYHSHFACDSKCWQMNWSQDASSRANCCTHSRVPSSSCKASPPRSDRNRQNWTDRTPPDSNPGGWQLPPLRHPHRDRDSLGHLRPPRHPLSLPQPHLDLADPED